jgi:hypothetical protein
MVAPDWRLPLLGSDLLRGEVEGRAEAADPKGAGGLVRVRLTLSLIDTLERRRPVGFGPPGGKAQEGRSREAGSIAMGRELRRGWQPRRAAVRKGASSPRKNTALRSEKSPGAAAELPTFSSSEEKAGRAEKRHEGKGPVTGAADRREKSPVG